MFIRRKVRHCLESFGPNATTLKLSVHLIMFKVCTIGITWCTDCFNSFYPCNAWTFGAIHTTVKETRLSGCRLFLWIPLKPLHSHGGVWISNACWCIFYASKILHHYILYYINLKTYYNHQKQRMWWFFSELYLADQYI